MKPVNIVLLVLAGAIGGAVIMKVVQRPHPAQVAAVESAPAEPPAIAEPAAPAPAPAVEPTAAPPAEPAAAAPLAEVTGGKTTGAARPRRRVPIAAPRRVPFLHPVERRYVAPPVALAPAPVVVAQVQTPVTPPARPPALQTPPLTPEQPQETPPGNMEPRDVTPVPAQIPVPPEPHTVTLNAGMLIPVRLVDSLSLERSHAGDLFAATLDSELDAGGFVIAERGARVEGKVVTADAAAKTLSIELTRVQTSDRQDVAIQTDRFEKHNEPDRSQDVTKVGAGAVIGAVIGGIAGGGKGAAIGAGVGGGAGAGGVMLSRKPVTLPSETRITFRLRAPVTITEHRD